MPRHARSLRNRLFMGCTLILLFAGGVEAKPTVWEYQVVNAGLSNRRLEALLNEKGADGWELVQISNNIAIFKRVKARPSTFR
jgi:hypothetical protein